MNDQQEVTGVAGLPTAEVSATPGVVPKTPEQLQQEKEERHRLKNSANKDHLQDYLKMLMEKKGIKPEDLRD